MKIHKLLFVCCFLLFSLSISAQRYIDAQNINVSGLIHKNGFGGIVGYEKLFGSNWNSYFVEVEFWNRSEKLRVKDEKAKLLNFNLNAGYRRYFVFKNTSPFISVGLFGGYEVFTNKDSMPETVYFDRKNDIQYGGFGDIGLEYFTNSFSIFGSVRSRYEIRNTEFIHSFSAGLKFYF